jgi:hypothetical protein
VGHGARYCGIPEMGSHHFFWPFILTNRIQMMWPEMLFIVVKINKKPVVVGKYPKYR